MDRSILLEVLRRGDLLNVIGPGAERDRVGCPIVTGRQLLHFFRAVLVGIYSVDRSFKAVTAVAGHRRIG